MKLRMRSIVLLAGVVGFALAAYCCLVAYLFLNRPDESAGEDGDLVVLAKGVSDADNMYMAYLALTNLVLASDSDAVLGALHAVSACPHYQGPTNSILPFNRMNEIARRVDDAVDALCKSGEHQKAASAIQDFHKFARSCRDNASAVVELLVGCGLCNRAYMMAARLSSSKGVSKAVLENLRSIVDDEPDFSELFRRTLKCEYSFWVKPGFSRMGKDADRRELVLKIDKAVASDGWSFAPIIARILAYTPGYSRFSYDGNATLRHVATTYREAQFNADGQDNGMSRIDVLKPNWYGRQMVAGACDAVVKSSRRSLKCNAMSVRFARIIVASQLYALKHDGQCPASLDALVPEFLDSVPKDPFDEESEVRYDPAEKLIWSVGEKREYAKPPAGNSKQRMRGFDEWAMRLDGSRLK